MIRNLLRLCALSLALSAAAPASARPAAKPTPAPTAKPAAAPKPTGLVDCGKDKVAIWDDTKPQDGAYALGWTLQRRAARQPVDWSAYDPQDPNTFINRYPTRDDLTPGDYALIYGVVDLRAKRFTPLSLNGAYYPHKPNADQRIAWSDESGGVRFALLGIDSGDLTSHRWLIEAGRGRVRAKELVPEADKAVHASLRRHPAPPAVVTAPDTTKPAPGAKPAKPAKHPKATGNFDAYTVTYAEAATPVPRFAANPFHAPGLVLPFRAFDPKDPDTTNYAGTVNVKLPGGGIAGVDAKRAPAPAPTPAATPPPAAPASGAPPLVPITPAPTPAKPDKIPELPVQ